MDEPTRDFGKRQGTSASAAMAMKSPSATSGSKKSTEIEQKFNGGGTRKKVRTGLPARDQNRWAPPRPDPNPSRLGHRPGCRRGPTQLPHRPGPKSSGCGHGVHHLDRAAVCFAGVVVRGHGFILGQAAVGKAPRSCRHRGGPHPENRGRHVHPRDRSLDECITLAGTPSPSGPTTKRLISEPTGDEPASGCSSNTTVVDTEEASRRDSNATVVIFKGTGRSHCRAASTARRSCLSSEGKRERDAWERSALKNETSATPSSERLAINCLTTDGSGSPTATPERMDWPRILVHTLDASEIAFDLHFGHLPGPIEQLGFMAARRTVRRYRISSGGRATTPPTSNRSSE